MWSKVVDQQQKEVTEQSAIGTGKRRGPLRAGGRTEMTKGERTVCHEGRQRGFFRVKPSAKGKSD